MKRIPYTNTTEQAAYVGGVLIQPGETRLVDALQVSPPDEGTPPEATQDDDQTHSVLGLLDRSVKDIGEALPTLTDDNLTTLETAENDGKTRKGVLEAIAAERIRRAQQNDGTPPAA